jgi:ABC-type glycerol-3-phosphate transport system substrate-binding protein
MSATPTRRRFLAASATLGSLAVLACAGPPSPPSSVPTRPPVRPALRPAPATPAAPPTTTLQPPPDPTAAPTPTPEPRSVDWWLTLSEPTWLAAVKAAGDQFRADHPSYTIRVTGGQTDFGKLIAGLSAGSAPDLLEPGALVPIAARGMARALDPYLPGSTIAPANFGPAMWANGQWQGQTLAIPALDHGPELGLIVNQTACAQGKPPWTAPPPSSWPDLYRLGHQLTTADGAGAIQVLGFDPLDGVGTLLDTVRDVTGHDWLDEPHGHVSLNHPAYEAFLSGLAAYYSQVGVDRLNQFRQGVSPGTAAATDGVDAGRQVAVASGYWAADDLDRLTAADGRQFSVTWLPSQPAGTTIQRLGGRVLLIPLVAARPDDAWALLQFLVGDVANQLWLERVGRFAATRTFLQSAGFQRALATRPTLKFYAASPDQAVRLTARSSNLIAGFAQTKWEQAIVAVAIDGQPVPDALNAAQAAVDAELHRLVLPPDPTATPG